MSWFKNKQEKNTPAEWYLSTLIDVKQPVTAKPVIGWDGTNYWVYFGKRFEDA